MVFYFLIVSPYRGRDDCRGCYRCSLFAPHLRRVDPWLRRFCLSVGWMRSAFKEKGGFACRLVDVGYDLIYMGR